MGPGACPLPLLLFPACRPGHEKRHRYANNILKGFATSISIVLSSVISAFFFDFQVRPQATVSPSALGVVWRRFHHPAQPNSDLDTHVGCGTTLSWTVPTGDPLTAPDIVSVCVWNDVCARSGRSVQRLRQQRGKNATRPGSSGQGQVGFWSLRQQRFQLPTFMIATRETASGGMRLFFWWCFYDDSDYIQTASSTTSAGNVEPTALRGAAAGHGGAPGSRPSFRGLRPKLGSRARRTSSCERYHSGYCSL